MLSVSNSRGPLVTDQAEEQERDAPVCLRADVGRPPPRRTVFTVLVALCVVTLVVFSRLHTAEFLGYDDGIYVTENPHVTNGLTWAGMRWAMTKADLNWHPLTWLSHMLDCQLFGLTPGAHHLTSVLLHVGNSALLAYVLLRLTSALWPSSCVAALFALHPLHVESVAWISERKDLLSTGFWFLAILAYLRYTERPNHRRYAVVCLCMILGLMSKGMVVTLPLTLLLLDYWPLQRWPAPRGGGTAADSPPMPDRVCAWSLLREKLGLFLIAFAGSAVQIISQRSGGAIRSLDEVPVPLRLANAVVSYAVYAWKMIWPHDLAVLYPLHPPLPAAGLIVGSALCLLAASSGVVLWGREYRYLVTGWLWYLVTLVPVIGFITIGYQSMADRYTYVPMIGLWLMLAWGVSDIARRQPAVRAALPIAAGGLLLLCALLTWRQLGYWHDTLSLFRHTVAVTTDNAIAENNLGVALKKAGQRDEARAHYAAALRIKPTYAEARYNMGKLYAEDGQLAAATEHFRAALALKPRLPEAHNDLGTTLANAGQLDEAEAHFRAAVESNPSYVQARMNLGTARFQRGDPAGAREQFLAVLALAPRNAAAHNALAQALEAAQHAAEARAAPSR